MKHSSMKLLAVAGAVAAFGLAACNGNNNNGGTINYPSCNPPGNLMMIYPANNAKNVNPNIQTVYVASSANIGNSIYTSVLQAPNGSWSLEGGFTQVNLNQIPKPHATPSFANPIYYSTFIGSVAPSSTWVVGFNNSSQNCQPIQIGQFTTF